jgi:hypothetical protein
VNPPLDTPPGTCPDISRTTTTTTNTTAPSDTNYGQWTPAHPLRSATGQRLPLVKTYPIFFPGDSQHAALQPYYPVTSTRDTTPFTPAPRCAHAGPSNPTTLYGRNWAQHDISYKDWFRCTLCHHQDPTRYHTQLTWRVSESAYVPNISACFLELHPTPALETPEWFENTYQHPPNISLIQAAHLQANQILFYVSCKGCNFFLDFNPHGDICKQVVISRLLHNLQEQFIKAQLFITPLELAILTYDGKNGYRWRNYTPYHLFNTSVIAAYKCHRFLVQLRVLGFRPWFPPLVGEYRTFRKNMATGNEHPYVAPMEYLIGSSTSPKNTLSHTINLREDGINLDDPRNTAGFSQDHRKRRKPTRPDPALPTHPITYDDETYFPPLTTDPVTPSSLTTTPVSTAPASEASTPMAAPDPAPPGTAPLPSAPPPEPAPPRPEQPPPLPAVTTATVPPAADTPAAAPAPTTPATTGATPPTPSAATTTTNGAPPTATRPTPARPKPALPLPTTTTTGSKS